MLAAISTMLDEAHIAGSTVSHLYNQGVDEVYIALGPCTDETREVLAPFPVTIIDDPEPVHYQPRLITELAHLAGGQGADWVIPFDADEYWFADMGSIADRLSGLSDAIGVVQAPQLHYHTRTHRNPEPNPLPKVAFRYHSDVLVANGNHSVSGVPGGTFYGLFLVRELQYSSFEHFVKKVQDRCRTLDPVARARGDGWHHYRLEDLSMVELREEWDRLAADATVEDPFL